MPRLRPGAERPFVIDRTASAPLPVQLAEQIRAAVRDRSLRPGDRVPATRTLAGQLGVSRGTVVAAYDQLTGEGYLVGARGQATVINPQLARIHPDARDRARDDEVGARAETADRDDAYTVDLRPGRTDTRRLADSGWRAAWRSVTSSAPEQATVPPAGVPALRDAIAEHLRLTRGLVADPDDILITAGAREGMVLLLLTLGRLTVAVEDPGYPVLRQVLHRLGATVVPVPVDDDGMVVSELARLAPAPDLVLVTPSHQYPLGSSMPVARRTALLEWAHEYGAMVVEDDYDSEFRYISAPLPSLASLAHADMSGSAQVINLGTFSKLLTPWLSAGYLIAPRETARRLIQVRRELGTPVSGIVQQALAEYLVSGGLRRHAARMRRDYKRRRELLTDLVSATDAVTVQPIDGGLHAVLQLSAGADAGRLVTRAAEAGVLVGDLADYWSDRTDSRPGIVVGYGGVSDDELRRGLRVLLDLL